MVTFVALTGEALNEIRPDPRSVGNATLVVLRCQEKFVYDGLALSGAAFALPRLTTGLQDITYGLKSRSATQAPALYPARYCPSMASRCVRTVAHAALV